MFIGTDIGSSFDNSDMEINVYPNPYSISTNISYEIMKNSKVKIEIYSSLGKLVAVLADENQSIGTYKYKFNARDYGHSSGVYHLKMTIDNKVFTKKLVEVR